MCNTKIHSEYTLFYTTGQGDYIVIQGNTDILTFVLTNVKINIEKNLIYNIKESATKYNWRR